MCINFFHKCDYIFNVYLVWLAADELSELVGQTSYRVKQSVAFGMLSGIICTNGYTQFSNFCLLLISIVVPSSAHCRTSAYKHSAVPNCSITAYIADSHKHIQLLHICMHKIVTLLTFSPHTEITPHKSRGYNIRYKAILHRFFQFISPASTS